MPSWLPQKMAGVYLYEPFRQHDGRGEFVKTYHAPTISRIGLNFQFREEFFSVSHKNVLRGMHLQKRPHAHTKIVYCVAGSILDVLVDLRPNEPSFLQTVSFDLIHKNRSVLWIPPGIAHGFLSLEDNSCVVYKTDCEHFSESDTGVRWDSIQFDWGVQNPIVSERDMQLCDVRNFEAAIEE